ncbi:PREDICTED: myosin-1-like [Nicrophorus vespilloides]|uniref:Myosin-1-like n=1 Tax=Nicrophorus vespilloides TaxID=110193 RepID=A0ABM1M0G6_NICVS|nr:PREDICTED: myosin-1-like [Nicrophorus vespilloides]
MDEDFDCVYDGLDEPLIAVDNQKLKDDNYVLSKKIHDLEQALHSADNEIMTLQDKNNVLATNISELYNTAKREIERKDRMIMELRKQAENLPFRSQGTRSDRRFTNQLHENSDYSKNNDMDRIKRFNETTKKQNLKRSMHRSPHRSRTDRRHSPSRDKRRYDRSVSPKRKKSNTPTRSRHSRQTDYSNRDRKSSSSRQDDRRKSRDNKINSSHMSIFDSVNEDTRFEDYGSPVYDGRNDNFGMSFVRAKSKEIKIVDSNIPLESNNLEQVKKNRKKIDLKDYLCRKNTENMDDHNITEKLKEDVLLSKESQDVVNKKCSEEFSKTENNQILEIVEIIVNQSDIKKDLELKDTKDEVESEIDKDYDHTMEICELVEDIKNNCNEKVEDCNISEEEKSKNSISNMNDSCENVTGSHVDIINNKTSEISGDEKIQNVSVGDCHITMDSNQETENIQIQDENNLEHENNKMHLFNGNKLIQCKVETNLEIESHDQQGDTENHSKSKEGIDEVELVYKMGNEPEKIIQCELPRYSYVTKYPRKRRMRITMENNITFVGENSQVKYAPHNTDILSKDNIDKEQKAIAESNVSSKSNNQSLLVELKTEDMETDEQRNNILEDEMKEKDQDEKKNELEKKEMETSKDNVEIKSENDNEISISDNLITNVSTLEPVQVKEEIKTENKNSMIIISTSKVVRSRRRYIFKKNT